MSKISEAMRFALHCFFAYSACVLADRSVLSPNRSATPRRNPLRSAVSAPSSSCAPPCRRKIVVACSKNACTLSLAGIAPAAIRFVTAAPRLVKSMCWLSQGLTSTFEGPGFRDCRGQAQVKNQTTDKADTSELFPRNVREVQPTVLGVTTNGMGGQIVEHCRVSVHCDNWFQNSVSPPPFPLIHWDCHSVVELVTFVGISWIQVRPCSW